MAVTEEAPRSCTLSNGAVVPQTLQRQSQAFVASRSYSLGLIALVRDFTSPVVLAAVTSTSHQDDATVRLS
jgi:hypothetical protein